MRKKIVLLRDQAVRKLDVLAIVIVKSGNSVVKILQNNNPSRVIGGVTDIDSSILKSKIESGTITTK